MFFNFISKTTTIKLTYDVITIETNNVISKGGNFNNYISKIYKIPKKISILKEKLIYIILFIYIYIFSLGSMARWDNQKLVSQRSRVRLQAVLDFLLCL